MSHNWKHYKPKLRKKDTKHAQDIGVLFSKIAKSQDNESEVAVTTNTGGATEIGELTNDW